MTRGERRDAAAVLLCAADDAIIQLCSGDKLSGPMRAYGLAYGSPAWRLAEAAWDHAYDLMSARAAWLDITLEAAAMIERGWYPRSKS